MNDIQTISDVLVKQRMLSWLDYRGIRVEIGHPHKSYCWTYYLYLRLDQFEDQELAEKLWLRPSKPNQFGRQYYRPYHNNFLSSLDFHGGITWYSKELFRGDKRGIKIGCDYQHVWDEGRHYDLEDIVCDAKRTIDGLHELCAYGSEGEGGSSYGQA